MTVQRIEDLQHFPLGAAYLCLEIDCGHVHNSNSWCPACHSSQIVPLTKWIAELVKKAQS